MTDTPNEPDDLNELLALPRPPESGGRPPDPPESPGVREAILRRTQRRLTFVRWSRRAIQVASAAAIFAVGVGVGVWQTPRERETVLVPAPVPQREVVTVPVPVLVPAPGSSTEPVPPTVARTAKSLELDAEQADDTATAAKLYRQAGDAFLNGEQDYANAARCYRLFLVRGGVPALSPEPSDSWLLTSLKNATFKETIHATSDNG